MKFRPFALGIWLPALLAPLLTTSCGRSDLLLGGCALSFSQSPLDFGTVAVGASAARSVTLQNNGAQVCLLSGAAIAAGGDADFSPAPGSTPLALYPYATGQITVVFAPQAVALPLTRTATLTFATNDVGHANVAIPLTAKIQSECVLAVSPAAVDFGAVQLGATVTESVVVRDVGVGACQVAAIAIGSGSDSEFALAAAQPSGFTLDPGASQAITVTFDATSAATPHHRTGTLTFESTDHQAANVTVPLSADIDIGCDLTISPPSVAFGNVSLNRTVTADVTLGNDGSSSCQVSGVALGAGTDPLFTLAANQPTSFSVAPGATATIPVSFGAFDSQPPFAKTGTLVFQTGNSRAPNGTVPLSAYIDTACVAASQWIYTVDQNGMFSRFDPTTLTFTDIGLLSCPDSSMPNSMAVDQSAVAWVAYSDGQLFSVDTSTAACQATSFVADQDGILDFGMGFVFQPSTGVDTLYIAGGGALGPNVPSTSTLATVAFPSLAVSPIGTVMAGAPELSGTGDGSLWGFVPAVASPNGVAALLQIDPASGATLQSFSYPELAGGFRTSNWAMKFWGGDFWIFLQQSIYRVSRTAPQTVTTAVADSGRTIVGAGVSTCAPLQ